ncbi:Flp pilus assembly protein CpaB [Mariniblastus sp.]|nr:Flp pilus assembly protein CpaB [Mariniblastus sp.]
MKSKSLILLVLSVGFGIIAAIGISQVMKGNANADDRPDTPMGPVVVAAGPLGLKTLLTEENVKIENWPSNIIPPEAITSLDQITDMVTMTGLVQGMPIVSSAIQHKNTAIGQPIPKNMKVVAVRVPADDTFANLLNPGDNVDVIGIFKQRDPITSHMTTSSRTFLKALKVYSIGNKTRIDNTEKSGNSSATSIVGLLVTEKQSEALVFVQDTGSIKLVLRGDDVENDGGVGPLEELKTKLATVDEDFEPKQPTGPSTKMEMYLGPDVETLDFNSDGTVIRDSSDSEAKDDNSEDSDRMSNRNDRGDSRDRRGRDRGIDDDQYRGE